MTETTRPYTLVAELTYRCPLHCPYCSNPVDIGAARWRAELETENWTRGFREARALGGLQLALTGGGPIPRRPVGQPVTPRRQPGQDPPGANPGTRFPAERAVQRKAEGLHQVQVSFRSDDPEEDDRNHGNRSLDKKIA